MSLKIKQTFLLSFFRKFNYKYPKPKELQPSPPAKDEINPEYIVKPSELLSENDVFNGEYINRNPRNLEQMLIETKPNGFVLDSPAVVFWNKLVFEKSLKHTSAKIVHNSGQTVVSASTQEWCIRKHLKSTIDSNAVINIARILALRCFQSGILFVHKEFTPKQLQTTKVQLLLKTLEEEGLKTEELKAVQPKTRNYW